MLGMWDILCQSSPLSFLHRFSRCGHPPILNVLSAVRFCSSSGIDIRLGHFQSASAEKISLHSSRCPDDGEQLDVEYPLAMKLTSDSSWYINPQVQLNIEFPQTKSRICCTNEWINSVVKISLANHSLVRTKDYYTPLCTVSVMNVSSGVLLEDFRSCHNIQD